MWPIGFLKAIGGYVKYFLFKSWGDYAFELFISGASIQARHQKNS